MEALAVAFTAAVVIALAVAIRNGSKRQRELLETTFGLLGEKLGHHDVEQRRAWGEIGGAQVSFRMTTRGSGKNATAWTEIDAAIPKQYPLRLFLRKHGWLDWGKIDRGDMVDVIVGDPAFDKTFLVEAAPAEVARILLDPRERSYLMKLVERLHFDIDTIGSTNPPTLRLAVRQWIYDANDAMRAIEAMVAIAGRVREAYAAVDRAAEARETGSPYRPVLDDSETRAAADTRLGEVARIDKLRTARVARTQAIAVAAIVGFLLLWIWIMAVAS